MKSGFALLAFVLFVVFLAGCASQAQTNSAAGEIAAKTSSDVEKVEMIHFHGTNQCYSCVTVGAYAEETINTYYADELKSGKIVFGHINGELQENQEMVVKYRASGSSLWIGTYLKNGSFTAEQNVNVWYKINDKDAYMTYLREVIDKKLQGG